MPAAKAPFWTFVPRMLLPVAQTHQALTRWALGQHERAMALVATLKPREEAQGQNGTGV